MTASKTCGTCGEIKPISDFAWHSGSANSRPGYRKLRSYCKACGIAQGNAWRKNHHSAVLVYNERYRQKKRGEEITPLITRSSKGGEITAQPYADWKRWRFSPEFMRLEDELGGVDTWKAMYQLCEEGSSPQAAAKALCQTIKSAEELKVLRHPWDTN